MHKFKLFISSLIASLIFSISFYNIAFATSLESGSDHSYDYEKKITEQSVIHIIKFKQADYLASLVKANSGSGRETVDSIARRTEADIAINGGFFVIGGKDNGKPTGTLVIDGYKYKLVQKLQSLMVINSGVISLVSANPVEYLKGDSSNKISILSAIPMLVKDGDIVDEIHKRESDFYRKTHARSALGLDKEGNIIIVVAEHFYIKDLHDITTLDVHSLLGQKGDLIAKKYNKSSPGDLTLNDLKTILKEEMSPKGKPKGLTLPDLAKLMQELGCVYALNLDGGGSSSLWVNGKIINNTVGDEDEGNGRNIDRPVSDAIIFRKLLP